MIINTALVLRAIENAKPSALALLNEEGNTWGPKGVNGLVFAPGLEAALLFTIGDTEGEDFFDFAAQKLDAAQSNCTSTASIATETPWQLKDGQNLYGGGVYYEGISVATSGANEEVDEAIASIILDLVVMYAKKEAKRRRTSGNEQDMII